ncbi:hypothetical protein [Nonomuraea sp. LPB2021202275-12-8]|uniref:hypothetical protein n=1 Tax=Nonomuraea sp. LPB2021202275-12-8 TaxID=3120159 RepID=UPI00300CCC5B
MTTEQAALNNAVWCEAVCRAHDRPGAFGPRAWSNPARTPVFYPDAVTLSPEATPDDVLAAIDAGPGASVKDSFASLDLRPAGFEVLFEATWLHRPAPPGGPPAGDIVWHVVRDAGALRAWEHACFGGEPQDLFRPPLLADEAVAILSGTRGGDIVCGSVLNATRAPIGPMGETVGVSNVFAGPGDLDAAWAGTIARAAALFPGRPLVGYESDPAPAAAHGFTPAGPLRVWLKA